MLRLKSMIPPFLFSLLWLEYLLTRTRCLMNFWDRILSSLASLNNLDVKTEFEIRAFPKQEEAPRLY